MRVQVASPDARRSGGARPRPRCAPATPVWAAVIRRRPSSVQHRRPPGPATSTWPGYLPRSRCRSSPCANALVFGSPRTAAFRPSPAQRP